MGVAISNSACSAVSAFNASNTLLHNITASSGLLHCPSSLGEYEMLWLSLKIISEEVNSSQCENRPTKRLSELLRITIAVLHINLRV